MFAMAPGQCCCSCQDCCNGSFPDEFDVEITLTDDRCTTCDSDLSGTFTLTRDGSNCRWVYYRSTSFPYCKPGYGGWQVYQQSLSLQINCVNDTQYVVSLAMTIGIRYVGACGTFGASIVVNTYYWQETVNTADFACASVSAFPLDYVYWDQSSQTPCWSDPGPSLPGTYLCNPTADATITAVP